jgi:CheY-like chemotaxis protein
MVDGPVVLIGDDDWASVNRLSGLLGDRLYLVLASTAGEVLRYARKFKPDVIVICEALRFGRGGAEKLLPTLQREFKSKVVILSEDAEAPARSRWRELGASECVPHPTKYASRVVNLGKLIVQLASEGNAP